MIRSFKYRIYPTLQQEKALTAHLREACDLYNAALQERRDAWTVCRKNVGRFEQSRELTQLRHMGLIAIPNSKCAQDVLKRVELAFSGFFRRCRLGGAPGFPRFRSVKRYDSLTFTWKNGAGLKDGRLRISGIGLLRTVFHRPIEGKVKTVCLRREAIGWFAVFSADMSSCALATSEVSIP